MTWICPNCGSQNCEEHDRCITCIDCGAMFKVWLVKQGTPKPIVPSNNYTEKQVDD